MKDPREQMACCVEVQLHYYLRIAGSAYPASWRKKWARRLKDSPWDGIAEGETTVDYGVWSMMELEWPSFFLKLMYEAVDGWYTHLYELGDREDRDEILEWLSSLRYGALDLIDEAEKREAAEGIYFPYLPGWDDRPKRENPRRFLNLDDLSVYER
ncbi:MAG: hypothetical protein Q3962_06740 [Corynebacterium sp.]|nr:hypothetical protein [Corynebacterium sp.]